MYYILQTRTAQDAAASARKEAADVSILLAASKKEGAAAQRALEKAERELDVLRAKQAEVCACVHACVYVCESVMGGLPLNAYWIRQREMWRYADVACETQTCTCSLTSPPPQLSPPLHTQHDALHQRCTYTHRHTHTHTHTQEASTAELETLRSELASTVRKAAAAVEAREAAERRAAASDAARIAAENLRNEADRLRRDAQVGIWPEGEGGCVREG